jgi:hypothetical protein
MVFPCTFREHMCFHGLEILVSDGFGLFISFFALINERAHRHLATTRVHTLPLRYPTSHSLSLYLSLDRVRNENVKALKTLSLVFCI